jgi:mono/diheme cytochrome c family protein
MKFISENQNMNTERLDNFDRRKTMKHNRIKFLAIALITLPMLAVVIFSTHGVRAVSTVQDEAAATYKAKCAMCHTAKADKFFDSSLKDEQLVETILKGEKKEKPPHMPEFASKGINAEQAQALVTHMRKLRNPNEAASGSSGASETPKEAAQQETAEKSREAIVAMFKSKCAACHTAKAEKFFDTSLKEDEMVQIILKGEKKDKPPHMPEFGTKGVTEKQAKALAAYMIELRTPAK